MHLHTPNGGHTGIRSSMVVAGGKLRHLLAEPIFCPQHVPHWAFAGPIRVHQDFLYWYERLMKVCRNFA